MRTEPAPTENRIGEGIVRLRGVGNGVSGAPGVRHRRRGQLAGLCRRPLRAKHFRPITQCLRHMSSAHRGSTIEIGNGSRNLESAVEASRRKTKRIGRLAQQRHALRIGRRHLFE